MMFGTEIDFTPLVEIAASLLLAVGTIVLAQARAWVKARFKVDLDQKYADILESGMINAIDYAKGFVKGEDGKITLEVKNAIVAYAVNYLIGKLPETLDHFGIDEDGLRERIEARLNRTVKVADAPAAPPVSDAYVIPQG